MAPLMDKDALAAFLGVKVGWVVKAITARELPTTWVGRHARFDPDEINAWLARNKEQPAEVGPVILLATGPRPPAGPSTPPPPSGPATPSKGRAA